MSYVAWNRFVEKLENLAEVHGNTPHLLPDAVVAMRELIQEPNLFEERWLYDISRGRHDGRLYTSERHGFFVQVFVWAPGAETPIHDHGTWGLMGVCQEFLRVLEYRIVPAAQEGQLRLKVHADFPVGPGGVVWMSPPDDEIHRLENISDGWAVSVHVYGAELDETQYYDPTIGASWAA